MSFQEAAHSHCGEGTMKFEWQEWMVWVVQVFAKMECQEKTNGTNAKCKPTGKLGASLRPALEEVSASARWVAMQ
jgi:hypothetical protein